jgi:hypothetical protein
MAVDLDNRRARAVPRKNLSGLGFCWTCTHCGWSPGQAYSDQPNERCFNCGFALYTDGAEGSVSETEALHMQVWHLKWALRFNHKLMRALAVHAVTGQMPDGYAPAAQWHEMLAKQPLEDVDDLHILKENWKDFAR